MDRDFFERLRLDDLPLVFNRTHIARSQPPRSVARKSIATSARWNALPACGLVPGNPRRRCENSSGHQERILSVSLKRQSLRLNVPLIRQNPKDRSVRGSLFAACEIAYQSLRDSGVSASGWLTRSSTRRALAIYNTSLAIFISEYSRALAGGNTTINVPTPFGPRTVAARYSPQSRYRPGYFDDLIPADFIKIAGFKKRVRAEGLGVPLVAYTSGDGGP